MSPRRIVPVVVALAALAGCKNVSQEAPAPELVLASFDSAVGLIPTPSDLALAASKDLSPSAQRILLQAFVQGGGFPGDQGVPVSIPLRRYVWNDAEGRYRPDESDATQPVVDPATVTTAGPGRNVVVLKVDESPPRAIDVELDAENSVTGVSMTGRLVGGAPETVRWGKLQVHKMKDANGSRRWEPGRYVFAVRGGSGGVRTTTRQPVQADRPILLVAPNLDLTNPKNRPILHVTPEQIVQLEQVRAALWQPLRWDPAGPTSTGAWAWAPSGSAAITPAFLAVAPYMLPGEVASIGTFAIAAPRPAIAVDSDSGLVPLPIDLARTGPAAASGQRTIGFNSAFGPAALGLTTLDGFSTTAMIFAPATIPVDASTVHGGSVHLFKKTQVGWALQREFKAVGGVPPYAVVAEPTPITTTTGNFVAAGVPCTVPAGSCSSLVALQPGVTVQLDPASFSPASTFYIPPLDEATDYAVVITTGVTTMPVFVPQLAVTTSLPLGRSAMARLLLETDPATMPLVLGGISLVSGTSPATATALQTMRQQLLEPDGVVSTYVSATGKPTSSIAMAYTFRTQSGIAATALKLVALPYGFGTGTVVDATFMTTVAAAQLYGAGDLLADPPGLASVAEVRFTTSNLLLGARNTGAFVDPALTPTLVVTETVTALVAIPDAANVASTCAHLPAPMGYSGALRCAPLVVYSHGLKNSKADVLPVAAALASRGFVVAAIDAEKHGERSYCSGASQAAADAMCCPASLLGAGPAAVLCGSSTCVPRPNLRTSVDAAAVVGVCETAGGSRAYLSYRADFRTPGGPCGEHAFLDPQEVTSPNPACFSPRGTAYATANMLLTTNFFRVRDSIRQDVVDRSALVKALAQIGLGGTDAFVTTLLARGIAVDFQKVYLVGHSYGAIIGAATLAANPRVSRAVTYAGGATSMDVFNNPESRYSAVLVSLLAQGGIQPGTSDFLKAIQIAKWILDPADPANFLGHVLPGSMPSYPGAASNSPFDPVIAGTSAGATALLSLWPEQPPRDALVMISHRERSVPNAQNAYYADRIGYPVVNPDPTSPVSSNVQWYMDPAGTGSVTHSNLLDLVTPSLTHQAQANAGAFLLDAAPHTSPVVP